MVSSLFGRRVPRPVALAAWGMLMGIGAVAAWAIVTDLTIVRRLHPPQMQHVGQGDFTDLVKAGQGEQAFEEAFEHGDTLFSLQFNAVDGSGANVGNGQRFTRLPRADLAGAGQWAAHTPSRATGPNAQACVQCHNSPIEDGAGTVANLVIRDPQHAGRLNAMVTRDTPHVFGLGATQRLAEEMTMRLRAIRNEAVAAARSGGANVTRDLVAKGIGFGRITGRPDGSVDTSAIRGVATDLIVRPFQWKGSVAFIRDFVRGAAHNELGMQPVELAGDGVDGDGDGVVNEMIIGDITGLTIYQAAQPRPTTRTELSDLGLIPALTVAERGAIDRGRDVFRNVGCAVCHVPSLTLDSPIFKEPSSLAAYRDARFPAGQDPVFRGLDPAFPISFDLTQDHPDNIIRDSAGNIRKRLGSFEKDAAGKAVIRVFGDLKRHDMGPGLAESIDEAGTGASMWLTRNLWGVGSTAPYLHDGRATTLTEAILEHGGEGAASRDAFRALAEASQRDLITYLNNHVLFKQQEE